MHIFVDVGAARFQHRHNASIIKEAEKCLSGSGKCNANAYQDECFAAERCAMWGNAFSSPSILQADVAVIAVANGGFAGVLLARRSGRLLFVYNVCVPRKVRGRGIGRRLIRTLFLHFPQHTLELDVAQRGSRNAEANKELQRRWPRVVQLYRSLGFIEAPPERTGYMRMRAFS